MNFDKIDMKEPRKRVWHLPKLPCTKERLNN